MALLLQNLTIRPESVQSLYASYLTGGFLVNRRYQRKLVWTIEEKRAFINSLVSGFPVPLFLFAELTTDRGTVFEIIDGMQRLNAIFAFLEGEFECDGGYFALETIPETKTKLEDKSLQQNTPVLAPEACRRVVTYQAPLSIARGKTNDEIDEIFRRINSHGKHLSKQELRQAGATSNFAELVRQTAVRIRGDVSATDQIDLARMKQVSITNKALPYGLEVQRLFWVENKILTPDQVRESRDEELIADMYGYILLDPKPPSRTEVLNEYYGDARSQEGRERNTQLETAVQKHSAANVIARFMRTHDVLRAILEQARKPFNLLMFPKAGSRVPRYFQVVFLAIYDLVVVQGKTIRSLDGLSKSLDGIGEKHITISEGGYWAASDRENNVEAVKGIIGKHFKKSSTTDPALDSWVTEFENILTQSSTENNLYDWKQGLHDVVPPHGRNGSLTAQIAKTIAAMANHGPGSTGYVILGVADDVPTAQALTRHYKIAPKVFRGFHVFGVDHEASLKDYRKGLDSYLQQLRQNLETQPLSPAYRTELLAKMRMVQYFDRHVVVLQVTGMDEPCAFDSKYYQRSGSDIREVTGEELKRLFRRFYA